MSNEQHNNNFVLELKVQTKWQVVQYKSVQCNHQMLNDHITQ